MENKNTAPQANQIACGANFINRPNQNYLNQIRRREKLAGAFFEYWKRVSFLSAVLPRQYYPAFLTIRQRKY